jgi:hypothetical protein
VRIITKASGSTYSSDPETAGGRDDDAGGGSTLTLGGVVDTDNGGPVVEDIRKG